MEQKDLDIKLPNGKTESIKYGTPVSSILKKLSNKPENILAVFINNKIYSLDKELKYNATIKPVFANTKEGVAVYRRSLCLLLAASAHKLYPNSRLLVGHSLGYGYYYTIETDNLFEEKQIIALEKEMHNLVEQNIPISSKFVSYEEAIRLFEESGLKETRHQLDFMCPPRIRINTLNDFSDLYFGPLVQS